MDILHQKYHSSEWAWKSVTQRMYNYTKQGFRSKAWSAILYLSHGHAKCKGGWECSLVATARKINTIVYPGILVDVITTNVINVLIKVSIIMIKFYDQHSMGRKDFISL